MFNLFKKKGVSTIPSSENQLVNEKKMIEEEVNKEIVVHVMPEHFRTLRNDAGKAKTTGLLILIGGFIFLVGTALGLYYYLFKYQPGIKAVENQATEPIVSEQKTNESTAVIDTQFPATTTFATTSDIITSIATTSTTTSEAIEQLIASSSITTVSVLAQDTDSDGLTDEEERLLGTNINSSDSDEDGYSDVEEVKKLYNPASSGKIETNLAIKKYVNNTLGYSLLYPSSWTVKVNDDSLIFIAPDNQIIQINIQQNTAKQTIVEWYKKEFGLVAVSDDRIIYHKNADGVVDWQGIKNDDNANIYLVDNNRNNIITINYNLGLGNTLNYPNIYQLVIDSFSFAAEVK